MFGTVWIHLIRGEPVLTQGLEGTAIVLEEINQFFVHSVNIYEYVIAESHVIEIYQYNGTCTNLPTSPSQPTVITHFTNISNIYLLKDTEFDYNIKLPLLNNSKGMEIYVTFGLDILDFNPHELLKENIICQDMMLFDGKLYQCHRKLPKSGYYSVHILLPSMDLPTNYSLSLSFVNSTLDLSEMKFVCILANLRECNVSFTFSSSFVCLVGNVLNTNTTDPFLAVGVSTTAFSLGPVLGITLGILVFILFIFLLVFFLLLIKLH